MFHCCDIIIIIVEMQLLYCVFNVFLIFQPLFNLLSYSSDNSFLFLSYFIYIYKSLLLLVTTVMFTLVITLVLRSTLTHSLLSSYTFFYFCMMGRFSFGVFWLSLFKEKKVFFSSGPLKSLRWLVWIGLRVVSKFYKINLGRFL